VKVGRKMPKRAFISLILRVTGNVNADAGIGTRIPIKKIITWNQEVRPFVSARCIRRCIRERLYEKGFAIDPLQLIGKGEKQLGDIGDPVAYVDDDLFGFLVPEEEALRRSSPIKISHLIALRHSEVKVEFAGRFPRDFLPKGEKGYPAPFEIEVADWLGKLNVIVTDRIGRFSDDELKKAKAKEEYKDILEPKKDEKNNNVWELKKDERKKRLFEFLKILLWEGWTFPRSSQGSTSPEYYYAVIALTDKFTPIFGYVDITDEGTLNDELINNAKLIYYSMLSKLIVIDYKNAKYYKYVFNKQNEQKSEPAEEKSSGALDSESMNNIINEITNYIVD
jgi:CRISPR-associated protein Cst2